MYLFEFHPLRLLGPKGKEDWFEITVLFITGADLPYRVMAGFSDLARDAGRKDFPDMDFRDETLTRAYLRWCIDVADGYGYKFVSPPASKKVNSQIDAVLGDDMTLGYEQRIKDRAKKRRVIL